MGDDGGARYRAFISYSHVDQAFGRRLHRRLERYLLPRRLVGRVTAHGPVPRRLAPVFRDREEFSAAGDLTVEVRAALAASGALIVVCSPAAAGSPWVAREVELFRELHPDRPVLAAVAAGEPHDCFPKPLTAAGEPLAADFRPHADGPRLGLLKLVAGVAGVGLDELVQRDAQRRLVGVTAVTAGAVALALVMTALTTFAVLAQREAERQRGQAEALVEFMLTDLRDRLKGVGRLDVLTSVNERTLGYYAGQEVERLPAESQARYARILHAMGEDEVASGKTDAADRKFRTAEGVTRRLLSAAPHEVDRIWAQGQSEYWLGFAAYRRGDRGETGRRWRQYRALSQALADAAPHDPKFRRELGYAEGNLCTLALAKPIETAPALRHCAASLAEMKALAGRGDDPGLVDDVINRHAWMADAYAATGDWASERREWLAAEPLLQRRMAADPLNARLKKTWVVQQRGIARTDVRMGNLAEARRRLVAADEELNKLNSHDPENSDWAALKKNLQSALSYIDREIRKKGT